MSFIGEFFHLNDRNLVAFFLFKVKYRNFRDRNIEIL
jgi:hypothetical protein